MPFTFDEDDSMFVPAAAISNVTGSPGATYAGPEQTILTNTQAAVNAILAALRAANVIAED